MKPIQAEKALFIKLGEGGSRETESFENGFLHFDYREIEHEDCLAERWDRVRRSFRTGTNSGAITRHINQIKCFYQEPKTTLWITFSSDRMWWCTQNSQ